MGVVAILSRFSETKYLDAAVEVTRGLKKGTAILIHKGGKYVAFSHLDLLDSPVSLRRPSFVDCLQKKR